MRTSFTRKLTSLAAPALVAVALMPFGPASADTTDSSPLTDAVLKCPAQTITILSPNGGESFEAGSSQQVVWTLSGCNMNEIRVLLSTDGGASYPVMLKSVGDVMSGSASWTVPMVNAAHAKLSLVAYSYGAVVALDDSDGDFAITGAPGATNQAGAATVVHGDPDFDLMFMAAGKSSACAAKTRIKSWASSAVYYCGADGMRHAFPNVAVYHSWFDDFSGIKVVSDEELAVIPLGRNMTFRSGSRLVKVQSDPTVYVVDLGAVLRAIPDESTAALFFGSTWSQSVSDVDVAFFTNYKIGETLSRNEFTGHVTLIK